MCTRIPPLSGSQSDVIMMGYSARAMESISYGKARLDSTMGKKGVEVWPVCVGFSSAF